MVSSKVVAPAAITIMINSAMNDFLCWLVDNFW